MRTIAFCSMFVLCASLHAQTVANTQNVFHPLSKIAPGGNPRNGISSVSRNRGLVDEAPSQASTAGGNAGQTPGKPAEIVAKIDPAFEPSSIKLVGTVSGLKGNFSVKNVSPGAATPVIQVAVLDDKGYFLGSAVKLGGSIAANTSEKIEIFATNVGAADLKVMKILPTKK